MKKIKTRMFELSTWENENGTGFFTCVLPNRGSYDTFYNNATTRKKLAKQLRNAAKAILSSK